MPEGNVSCACAQPPAWATFEMCSVQRSNAGSQQTCGSNRRVGTGTQSQKLSTTKHKEWSVNAYNGGGVRICHLIPEAIGKGARARMETRMNGLGYQMALYGVCRRSGGTLGGGAGCVTRAGRYSGRSCACSGARLPGDRGGGVVELACVGCASGTA